MKNFRRSYKVVETDKGFRIHKGKYYYRDPYQSFNDAERDALLMQAHDAQCVIDEIKNKLDETGLVEYNDFHNHMC